MGDAVLTNVSLRFRNGGHYIQFLGVERIRDGYEAWFQDPQSNDDLRWPDDPFDLQMQYVILAQPSQGLNVYNGPPVVIGQ